MAYRKEDLVRDFAKSILTGLSSQIRDYKNLPPEKIASMALDYAEAVANEFNERYP